MSDNSGIILKIPVVKPDIVLREESDDWALLFDLNTGSTFGLNPSAVQIFKDINGKRTTGDLMSLIKSRSKNTPPSLHDDLVKFLSGLVEAGYVTWS